jgi:hypothetical protein
LVARVLLAPDACGSLASLVLLVPSAGVSFMPVVRFRVFCPSRLANNSASLLPSCLRFLVGVRYMVDMILAAGVVVCALHGRYDFGGGCRRVVVVVCIGGSGCCDGDEKRNPVGGCALQQIHSLF